MAFQYSVFDSTLHRVNDDDKALQADNWFQFLNTIVHPEIDRNRRDNQKPVGVAILDSGVDSTHPDITLALERKQIAAYKGFPESLDPLQDQHGHGTHGVSVLMKTAPHAALYVARIVNDEGEISEENDYLNIVDAIRWAIEQRVNIISISWGMKNDVPSIASILNDALKRGILVFASASNVGANDRITFPARVHGVFCIGSADTYGNRSRFSPPFEGEEKYSALGEAVLAACPEKFSKEPGYDGTKRMIRRDGTSTATPIAAGIAALLIDFTRQFMDKGKRADTYENMRKLFIGISEATVGKDYRYLALSYIFGPGKDSKAYIKNIISVPAVLDKHWSSTSALSISSVHKPVLVFQQKNEPSDHFVERESASSDSVYMILAKYHRVAITGLPGVGKTELCNKIVLKAHDMKAYKGIFWLSAATDTSIQSGLVEMARQMKVYNEEEMDIEKLRHSVVNELNREEDWLLVLDNVDDIDLVKKILPEKRGNRHVLITTRDREMCFELFAEEIYLDVMNNMEAISLLLENYPAYNGEGKDTNDAASVLVAELGYLPLAIVQAAAYLRATRDKIVNYTELYRHSRRSIWNWMPRKERSKHPKGRSYISVMATMAVAFQKIKQEEVSVRLFCLLSFFSPNNIPQSLFTADTRFQDAKLRHSFSAIDTLNDALEPLLAYAFIQRSAQTSSVSIHKLVQDIMRDILDDHDMDKGGVLDSLKTQEKTSVYWMERAFEALGIAYPNNDPENWRLCETLNPHAFVCIEYNRRYGIFTSYSFSLATSSGIYWYDHGSYDSAEDFFITALQISEKAFGGDHINTAQTINNLGLTYTSQGKYDEAVAQYELALRIYENAIEVDHINTADTINNLGMTYQRQGKYDEAIALHERALRIYGKAFGVDHINMANTINNLGSIYHRQGKYDEAIAQYERALRIYEKAFGADHINMADTINNLGVAYESQGKYDEAIAQYERALRIREKAFGVDHINTADTLNNLGKTYESQGKYDEAIAQYEWALKIYEKAFGVDHINMANTINNLGVTYESQGKYDKAIAQYERALRIYEKTFGLNHINLASTINNLGSAYDIQGKYDEARAQYEWALRIFEKTFGVDHINTADIINNLGTTYYSQDKYDEAILHYERSLRIEEKAFGVGHINTARMINNLGLTYDGQGKYDEAVSQYEQALKIYAKSFGMDHIKMANTIKNLGSTHSHQGKYDEAIAHYERALRIQEKTFGVDHVNTADTIDSLGLTYATQGKYDEAIAHYERALKIFQNTTHPDRNVADVHERIAKTLLNRFSKLAMTDDLENVFAHLRLSISTAVEQDPSIHHRLQRLRRFLLCIFEETETLPSQSIEFFNELAADCFVEGKYLIARFSYENALKLDPRNDNITDFEDLVHDSIICDGCSNPMTGFRFKCQSCNDYDLCSTCYERRSELHSLHKEFLQIPDEKFIYYGFDPFDMSIKYAEAVEPRNRRSNGSTNEARYNRRDIIHGKNLNLKYLQVQDS